MTASFPYRIGRNRFGDYCIPNESAHRPAARRLLHGGVWEPGTIELMARHAAMGDVVHAGAYFGDFLPGIGCALARGRVLWAFEPNPINYQAALVTAQLNRLRRVRLLQAALGQSEAALEMRVSNGRRPLGGASRVVRPSQSASEATTIQVSSVALDDFLPRRRKVSLIQLDVEGFETEALTGGLETIRAWKPTLILEHLPRPKILDALQAMGYRIIGRCHANAVLEVTASGQVQEPTWKCSELQG